MFDTVDVCGIRKMIGKIGLICTLFIVMVAMTHANPIIGKENYIGEIYVESEK